MKTIRQANRHLFGIVTRYHHQHGRRVHKPALTGDTTRSRWYGNYGMFRYATRMSASYATGGQSEFEQFGKVAFNAKASDGLVIARIRRYAEARRIRAAIPITRGLI